MMLRIHCLQQWLGLSNLGAEEALFEMSIFRDFVGLRGIDRIPYWVSLLRFRRVREEHDLSPRFLQIINNKLSEQGLLLKAGTVVDVTLIAAPSSIKTKDGERNPQMHPVTNYLDARRGGAVHNPVASFARSSIGSPTKSSRCCGAIAVTSCTANSSCVA
jgi:IS5 family transposase